MAAKPPRLAAIRVRWVRAGSRSRWPRARVGSPAALRQRRTHAGNRCWLHPRGERGQVPLGQHDDAPPGIPGVLIPEDVAATLGRTGMMPAVVLDRDLFLLVGEIRVLDPA